MQGKSGLVAMIEVYNFIVSNLVKEDVELVLVDKDIIEVRQGSNIFYLPEVILDVMTLPKGFKKGKLKKDDLIKLYDKLEFIVGKEGRVSDQYTNSIISPEDFGFSIWSKYHELDRPGLHKIDTIKFISKSSWISW